MKKILISLLLFSSFVYTQEIEKRDRIFSFNHQFFTYIHNHKNFGDNFLSKANKPTLVGFGFQYNLMKFYNVKFGFGYEYLPYKVTDESMAGNIKSTNHNGLFSRFQYEYALRQKFSIEPYAGIGYSIIKQKNGNRNFGKFNGTSFTVGTNIVYELNNYMSLFGGTNYTYTKYDVKTASDYEKFFQNSNQIQFSLGFIFTLPKKL